MNIVLSALIFERFLSPAVKFGRHSLEIWVSDLKIRCRDFRIRQLEKQTAALEKRLASRAEK